MHNAFISDQTTAWALLAIGGLLLVAAAAIIVGGLIDGQKNRDEQAAIDTQPPTPGTCGETSAWTRDDVVITVVCAKPVGHDGEHGGAFTIKVPGVSVTWRQP